MISPLVETHCNASLIMMNYPIMNLKLFVNRVKGNIVRMKEKNADYNLPGMNFPIITASLAPVALGTLLGLPEIASLARMAKAIASLALGEMPNLSMECI
ncbi:MAG: hypothetical protein A2Z58_01190 [Planctomycetes bacterium RIFCSPHIGHO2_12_42_15]|nr:MAG: hypothetical protein A2Z58_01190 [Planctomycetes bacterium RIFCSPHIGHO2_12_42_15]